MNSTKQLVIRAVGYEPRLILLTDSCRYLEIILLLSGSYDFRTPEEVDRLRLKRFEKLPQLHKEFHGKGVFKTERPCYKQKFIANTKWKHFQKII